MADNDSIESTDDQWCDSTNPRVIEIDMIEDARKKIMTPDGIQVTPCLRANLSDLMGTEIYLKLENFNKTGAFKERGARYTLMNLSDEQKKVGAVAASLGNHSQGMSYHGMVLGIPITVVMPHGSSLMKINKCLRYKANVVLDGKNMTEAKKIAKRIAKETGAAFVNGYDHPHVIAGQGTIGLEILEQVGNPDAVLVPCGGGGLIAGIATAIKTKSPNTEVIGVEADICATFSKALKAGKPKLTECLQSLADGLAVAKVGYNAIATCKGKVEKVVRVTEAYMNVAILTLIENEKIICEGAGASPLAALLTGELSYLKGKKVVLLCSGGNIDTLTLGKVLERALVSIGKLIKVNIVVADKAESQAKVIEEIGKLGANLRQITTERAWLPMDDFAVKMNMMIEVRDIQHAIEFRISIKKQYPKCDFPDFPSVCKANSLAQLRM